MRAHRAVSRPASRAMGLALFPLVLSAALCSCAPTRTAEKAPLPIHVCAHTSGTITIDGVPDEPAWRAAEWLEVMRPVGKPPAPPQRTRAALLWDDLHLYFAAEMEDTEVFAARLGRDVWVWKEDCVEFYLDPIGRATSYYELDFGPAGGWWDSMNVYETDTRRMVSDRSWNPPSLTWKWARTAAGWTMEGRIRLDELPLARHIPPQHGDEWRGQVYRVDARKDAPRTFTSWSTVPTFHWPEGFGRLRFEFPARNAEMERRAALAGQFKKSAAFATATSLAGQVCRFALSCPQVAGFVFDEKANGWKAAEPAPAPCRLLVSATPGVLDYRNECGPGTIRWREDAPGRIVVLARLDPSAMASINEGQADGAIVRLSAPSAPAEEVNLYRDVWQLLEVKLKAPGEVVLATDPGPLGNALMDKLQFAIYRLPAE